MKCKIFIISLKRKFTSFFFYRVSNDFLRNESIQLAKSKDESFFNNALSIKFSDDKKTDFCSNHKGRITVHYQNDPPIVGVEYHKMASFFKSTALTQIILSPKIMTSDNDVRDVDVKL